MSRYEHPGQPGGLFDRLRCQRIPRDVRGLATVAGNRDHLRADVDPLLAPLADRGVRAVIEDRRFLEFEGGLRTGQKSVKQSKFLGAGLECSAVMARLSCAVLLILRAASRGGPFAVRHVHPPWALMRSIRPRISETRHAAAFELPVSLTGLG